METVMKLLEEIEDILENSKNLPFSSKIGVDREDLFEIIAEIRLNLPNDIKQSKKVLEERSKIIVNAHDEAEEIIKNAETQINKMIDENEITRRAKTEAEGIIDEARKDARELRLGAVQYADEVLSNMEKRIKETMDSIEKEHTKTEDFFNDIMEVIYNDRKILRGENKK